jgi:tetratricopeptide (TPR) repeat protein
MAYDLQDLVGHALALHQRGMLADAERLYLDVLRVQPDNADVLQLAGVLALQTGRAAQGVALIHRALQAGHRSAAAFSNLGEGLRALGRPEDALACYDRAIALQPDGPAAHYNRGNVLADLRRHEAALASYERAIVLKPDYFRAHANLGKVLADLRRYAAALASCDTAIAFKPDYAPAHCNRGVVLAFLGRNEEALASHAAAIALQPGHAEAYCNRGAVLTGLGRHDEALASLDRAILLQPDYADAHFNRGHVLAILQRHAEALASYDRAIVPDRANAGAYFNRGVALAGLQRHGEALASYEQAIAIDPDYAEAHANRGAVLIALQRHDEALAGYDQAIALKPEAATWTSRGVVLGLLQRHDEALASHDRAIALEPDRAEAHLNRGVILAALRRYEEALASHDRAILLKPDDAEAHFNRGYVLAILQRHAEALASYDRAIALRPDYAEAYANRGLLVADQQHHEEALVSYEKAIALRPNYAQANHNYSLCLLALGRFEAGWRQYEWRARRALNLARPRPFWLGQTDIAGKTVFIHWEQGLGDTIQFCRYARLVAACGAQVVMSVQDPLRRLLATLAPGITIVGGAEEPEAFDYQCPLLSLPLAFATTIETIPCEIPYLAADPAAVAVWRERLAGLTGLRVGLCWAGNPRSETFDRRRSFALGRFAPLAVVEGVDFVSLQKGEAAAETGCPPAGLSIADWTEDLQDFADTAALIETLDLVITVDTAVAHLAGALGKPVWVLNRFDACWRWLLVRTDSPWYPTARLFHQPRPGDWDSVIAAVADALRAMVTGVSRGAGGGAQES